MPTIPVYDEEGKFQEFKFIPDTPQAKQITSYSYSDMSTVTQTSQQSASYQQTYFKNSSVSDGNRFEGFNDGTKTYIDATVKAESSLLISFEGANSYYCNFPCIPDSISENTSAQWSTQQIIGRASPVAAMTGTSFRSASIGMKLHRDMYSLYYTDPNYIDELLANLRRAVYPKQKTQGYIPAIVTFTSADFKIKGMLQNVDYEWQKPLIENPNGSGLCYAICDIKFSINEILPKNFDGATSGQYFQTAGAPFTGSSKGRNLVQNNPTVRRHSTHSGKF